MKQSINIKNRTFWTIVFVIIAGLSIWAVINQSKTFSLNNFKNYILACNPWWLVAAFLAMILFILSESWAFKSLCELFKIKTNLKKCYVYSASDIYFSAITPSATGGQAASAYFMFKDKIPGSIVSIILLLNISLYIMAMVILGLIGIIFFPEVFKNFGLISKVIICIGFIMQIILVIFFLLVLFKKELLTKIIHLGLNILNKLHLVKDKTKHLEKINKDINDFHSYTKLIRQRKIFLLKAFLFNFLQRICQLAVVGFAFIAFNSNIEDLVYIITVEIFTIIGTYCIPIPGGIGATDYLMIDGFKNVMSLEASTNLELFSRGISFYICVLICGVSVLIKYYLLKRSVVK